METIKVYRCRQGNCKKLSTSVMIGHYSRCFNCHFREFTGPGKIGLLEEIITLIRHYIIQRREKSCLKVKK